MIIAGDHSKLSNLKTSDEYSILQDFTLSRASYFGESHKLTSLANIEYTLKFKMHSFAKANPLFKVQILRNFQGLKL